ncbi:putative nucleotidyltransferase, ribonuclease H [Tanacetum coccineum]
MPVPSGKANVVADTLSSKNLGMKACFDSLILHDLDAWNVELCVRGSGGLMGKYVRIEFPNLMLQIKRSSKRTTTMVPNDQALREKFYERKLISSPFTIHPQLNQNVHRLSKFTSRASGFVTAVGDSCVKIGWISMDFRYWITESIGELVLSSVQHFILTPMVFGRYLCLVEFAYNNSWHASIKAAPFELLYGRKCRAPICWDEVGERLIEGPELIEITNEKVAVAKEKLKEARSRQKSYADKHRRDLEFQVGDRVFLKVSPFRGVKRFGIKGKLSPRFIGPFEILERIGEVSYRLALPPQLSHVHDVFHVSLLRGYHYHPLHVASYPFDQIQPDMSLSEEPESILDRQERVMRNKVIPFVKILWKNHPEREATWETEESMRASYPHFFV